MAEIKTVVKQLLTLRQERHVGHSIMPHLLLISPQERFSLWAEQVNQMTLKQGHALLDASKPEPAREHMDLSIALASPRDLKKGAYAPIWHPLHAFIEQDRPALTDITSFLDRVASQALTERFSQYFTWKRACSTDPEGNLKDPLTRSVNIDLQQAAAPFIMSATPRLGKSEYSATEISTSLSNAFYGGTLDRLWVSAILTLALSAQQKQIITHLAQHPLLSRADLHALLSPGHNDERLLLRQIMPLIHLGLLKTSTWTNAPTSRERERYHLCEPALRWLTCRNALSPAYYLERASPDQEKQQHASPFAGDVTWVQRSARGLWGKDGSQMFHTSGIYRCVRSMHLSSHRSQAYQILSWKSARESVRWYRDPSTSEIAYIRPDAELLYKTPATVGAVRSFLIEYDRDTTNRHQLASKWRCYAEYQQETRITLPTTLVITQNEQAIEKIWRARNEAKAFGVSLVVVLEEQVVRDGLLPVLGRLP